MANTSSRNGYDFRAQIGHLLRRAYQCHLAIFQRLVADPQLTAAQFVVLCAIQDLGPSSVADIGRRVSMDPATTRGTVDRLSERGLLSIGQDSEDRRRFMVALTESGRQLLEKVFPSAREITDATMHGLNPGEQVALTFLLQKMIESNSSTGETNEG